MDAHSTEPAPCSPSVTVIMATFNRAELIAEAIDSILNQTRPPEEFIIVNDGSTDDTAKVIRAYGNKIKYVEKANGGKPSALNMALPLVTSTYTWIFDDDDVALPHALESHLKFLSEHPQWDFSYSTHYLFSGSFSEEALKHARLRKFSPGDETDYFSWIMESAFLGSMMQGMLIPTRCYRAVGGFDEEILRGHDWDIMLRIARGFRGGFLDKPTFALRDHDGARGPNSERHAEADRYRIWKRYERRTFKKLYAEAGLGEYLPGRANLSAEGRPLSAMEMRQALLRRAMVMAIHGLLSEASDDFRGYLNQLDAAAFRFNDAERRQVSMLAYVQNSDTVPPPDYYRTLGGLIRGRRELFRAAMRGLYWSITREVRRRHFVFASRLVGRAVNLACAYAGMPAIGRRRAREFS